MKTLHYKHTRKLIDSYKKNEVWNYVKHLRVIDFVYLRESDYV